MDVDILDSFLFQTSPPTFEKLDAISIVCDVISSQLFCDDITSQHSCDVILVMLF
jgi:hypothetical protein